MRARREEDAGGGDQGGARTIGTGKGMESRKLVEDDESGRIGMSSLGDKPGCGGASVLGDS